MAKFSNDFYISLNYFNGKFQAQIGRDYGRYSHCNSKEMLKIFEDIYQFMYSDRFVDTIAGIKVEKKKYKDSEGRLSQRFNMDFGVYLLRISKSANPAKKQVNVSGYLPFYEDNEYDD